MERKIGLTLALLLMGMALMANLLIDTRGTLDVETEGSSSSSTTPTQRQDSFSLLSAPPPTEWNQTYGGTGDEIAFALVQTADGGYALLGDTDSFGAGYTDVWLVKTDASGNHQWNKTYGGTYGDYGSDLVQTADGGYALAGDTLSFGAGFGDFWLVKTYANGNHQWNKTYGGTDPEWYFEGLAQTSDGGYAISGRTLSFGAGSYDFWLVKTDASGMHEWNQTYGGTGDETAFALVQTADSGYAIAGFTNSSGAGSYDFWLVKIAPVHDVAVVSVTASPTSVTQGQTVWVTVVVENEGDFLESFSVTSYYDNTAIGSITLLNLSPGYQDALGFHWNTAGVALGTYTIKAIASTVPGETDTADNTKIDGTVTVIARDVAVVSVTASPTSVAQGQTVTVTVEVKNEGDISETFSVTTYYDNTAISSQTVTNLSPGASQTLYFYWITAGVALGTYTIKAVASTVPDETDTADNTKIDGTVTVIARDVAVVSVTASPTSVTQGQTVTVTVVVKNEGDISETFLVDAYYDNTPITLPSQIVTNLSPGASETLYFYWDTSVVSPEPYIVKAKASTVPGETDTADNTKIDGTVVVNPKVGSGVGGFVVPIDKFGLLAPYIGLASTIIVATAATAIYVKRIKHRKEKQ